MSYCPKCGNKVDETMAFCPKCGAALKGQPPSQPNQPAPTQPYGRQEKAEKNEKQENQEKGQHGEKGEKQEKTERGFVGYLIGGLILITIGVFSLLELSAPNFSGQDLAIMLFIIGAIIIVGAVYVALTSRRHFPKTA